MIVFKGKPYANLEQKLKKNALVKSGKIFIACQNYAWVDSKIFSIWLD